ncbi:MAG: DUF5107 domain-containing protein [Eubacteriales bacterium]
MLNPSKFLGADSWVLENDHLSVVVLPAFGGKIGSIYDKKADFELLFQNPKTAFTPAPPYADFSQYEACGFDDAFPGVDAETVTVGGKTVDYPDHGEIWTSQMEATAVGDCLHLAFTSPILGYVYKKTVYLDGQSVVVDYHITNPTDVEIPAIWTCHCLVNWEDGMKILMPQGVDMVENTFAGKWLGEAKAKLSYPVAQTLQGTLDLRKMPPDDCLKFYATQAVEQGYCAYEYPNAKVRATFSYDREKLPYLGLWATSGGFRGDKNCALEPSTGYYDSVNLAQKYGRCSALPPRGTMEFSLKISLFGLLSDV